jgi:tRNA pseudouridine55 synthase
MRCGKGTYVRTLCAEIGEALGCGAHLEQLRRTASGALKVSDAIPLAELVVMDREEAVRRILPVAQFAAARGAGRSA